MNTDKISNHDQKPPVILREYEFFGGSIRVKISVKNTSGISILDATLDLDIDEKILHFERFEPEYPEKKGKLILGNIKPNTDRTVALYLDPLICAKEGTDVNCRVDFSYANNISDSVHMESLKINVICPVFHTENHINIGRLKELGDGLAFHDSKVYTIPKGVGAPEILGVCRDVVLLHDVLQIKTFKTVDDKTHEAWYYGKTKVTKRDLVIRCSIFKDTNSIEVFAAGVDLADITGLLAEIGRNLKQKLEEFGNIQPVFNIHIKDSIIQRSNLLSFCDVDGTCSGDVLIEDSVVQRSNIASGNEVKLHKEKEVQTKEQILPKQKTRVNVFMLAIVFGVLILGFLVLTSSNSDYGFPSPVQDSPEPMESSFSSKPEVVNDTNASTSELIQYDSVTPAQSFQQETYINSINMEFMLILPGEFAMGSSASEIDRSENEGPIHMVNFSKGFYIGKYEVTQKQWHWIMRDNPSYFKGDDLPVDQVSWDDVQKFIRQLNEREGTKVYKYRLPSEAEWEYASRVNKTELYDNQSELGDYSWYTRNSQRKTHPVGQKTPNLWGVYDMHGNVYEWVQDIWHGSYIDAPVDGSVWKKGISQKRVFRGGCWNCDAGQCRSAFRGSKNPDDYNLNLGFRVVKEI